MPLYLITYDLNKPNQDYESLYEKIEELTGGADSYIRPLESVWIIASNGPASHIREELQTASDWNDYILVTELVRGHVGFNLEKPDGEWLLDNL